MKERKAQGALEFLMTYGWAFLVILIMIGALAYFGVLNPTRFLPDRCEFATPPFMCKPETTKITSVAVGTLIFDVTNNFGQNIKVYSWTATTDFPGVTCPSGTGHISDGTNSLELAGPFDWGEGVKKTVTIDCTNGATLTKGTKIKFKVSGLWYPSTTTNAYAKTTEADIYAAVQ